MKRRKRPFKPVDLDHLAPREQRFRAIVEDCVVRLGYCPGPTELNARMETHHRYNHLGGNFSTIRRLILEANGWVHNEKGKWVKA